MTEKSAMNRLLDFVFHELEDAKRAVACKDHQILCRNGEREVLHAELNLAHKRLKEAEDKLRSAETNPVPTLEPPLNGVVGSSHQYEECDVDTKVVLKND